LLFRVAKFEAELEKDEIDRKALQKLCFDGIFSHSF